MSTLSQFFGGGKRKYQEFLTSGTFIPPTGVEVVDVLVVGAGGGGGGNDSSSATTGGAGGLSSFGSVVAAGGGGGGGVTGSGATAGGKGGGLFGGVGDTSSVTAYLPERNGNAEGFLIGGGAGAAGNSGISIARSGACPGFGASSINGSGAGGASFGDATEPPEYTNSVGVSGAANSGAGGTGGRRGAGAAGGGGGGEINARFNVPVSGPVTVTVGAGGAGGTAATGYAGGAGGSGRVIVYWME